MQVPSKFKKIVVSEDSEERLILGVVYSPDEEDTQGDAMDVIAIKKMAHNFLASGYITKVDTNHNYTENGSVIVQSFIARDNDPDFAKGSWVVGVRLDPESWEKAKAGELNGFSMAGISLEKEIRKVLVEVMEAVTGETEKSTIDILPEHSHEFYIKFDDDGLPEYGETDYQLGHKHIIIHTDSTEMSLDHAHKIVLD